MSALPWRRVSPTELVAGEWRIVSEPKRNRFRLYRNEVLVQEFRQSRTDALNAAERIAAAEMAAVVSDG